jgi:GNAT superfamily N-acetyltransferase
MIPIIRAAQAVDAERVAEIHVRAWQWAYRDLLPAAFLAGLSVERRAAYWRRWLSDSGLRRHLWLSTREAHVVGFAATSPSRDADANTETGELLALYLEPEIVGTGAGRALCARAEDGLRHDGFRAATLWVLESNARARRFYERCGWQVDGGEKAEEFGDRTAREVRYRKALTA